MHTVTAAELPALPLCPPADRYTYHVVVSACTPAARCMGVYRRVAVLRVDHHERPAGYAPKTIREIRGVKICALWDKVSVGKTERSAFFRALSAAQSLRADLAGEPLAN